MKRIDVLAKSATACAVLLLVAACGGGGSTSGTGSQSAAPAKSEPSVQLSGTAATGAALANASVAVKCANAQGTATTDASGKYSLKLTGGALPCVIEVTGEQGGVAVTLHSLAEAGSTDSGSGTTSAAANVTPLTEMIVAQLSAGLPSDLFAAFGSGATVSSEQLVAATNAVLSAIKDATGIDLGTIDPFKAPLVAATSSAPSGGNLYDNLLDQLGAKVSIEALPQVVNQIANSSGSGSGTAGLGEVMQAAQKGPLAGCPVAASGTYRLLDHYGRTSVAELDFSAMTYKSLDGQSSYALRADSTTPCQFTGDGTRGTDSVHMDFAMGNAGLAVYRSQNLTTGRDSVGYLFPVQSHTKAEMVGEWTMLHAGFVPSEDSWSGFGHWIGKLTFGADDKIQVCDIDYRNAPGTCVPETDANLTLSARADGGFDVNGDPLAPQFFGYRSPSGALTVFGTTNPEGININTNDQSHFILTKHQVQAVPAVGTVSKYFDVQFIRQMVNGAWANVVAAPVPDATTITSVDGNTVTRERASDKRKDTVHYNQPLPGLRLRDAGTNPDGTSFAAVYQFTMPGSGVNVSFNAQVTGPSRTYLYIPSVQRN
ncbi:MAG: hypothetical protein JSS14_09620 [Proteobacteria bacterium]|nr:hypothetical protein [Pseudomonadota bacterium]